MPTTAAALPFFERLKVLFSTPAAYVAAGSAAGILLVVLVWAGIRRHRGRKAEQRNLEKTTSLFVGERQRANLVLQDLDVGVLLYNASGQLVSRNPAAHALLATNSPPEKFNEFLRAYGRDNGIHANLLLGTGKASGQITINGRTLRIRVKETWQGERKAGSLIVISDITDTEQEEHRRKDFVANVSHELKTPLTTIMTYLESLLDWGLDEKPPSAVRKDILRIQDDAFRMKRLIDDLLLLSSIDSSGWMPRMEQLDIDLTVRQTADRMGLQAKEKDIAIECFTVSRVPLVFVDRNAIERVISNLVSNAIKYTGRNGEIRIYTSSMSELVIVKVSDTGFGIDPEHIDKIFDRFYRVDMTGSRMYGGTGLGLAIARELVEMHSGRISVTSELGIGTEFTVTIPSARKTFRETLAAILSGAPYTDPFHQAAAEELSRQATVMGIDLAHPGARTRYSQEALTDLVDRAIFGDEEAEASDAPVSEAKDAPAAKTDDPPSAEDMESSQNEPDSVTSDPDEDRKTPPDRTPFLQGVEMIQENPD